MSLRLDAVSVFRAGRAIVNDVSLECVPGGITAFCGANGAGKTTALKVLVGALKPDKGRALLSNQLIDEIPGGELARRRAAVPQHPLLAFPFRVHEVVEMGRTPHFGRVTPADDAEAVLGAIQSMGLSELADRDYLTLSGGERQRVMIARALAQVWFSPEEGGARWLLLDEPTSALDLKHQLALMTLLKKLANEGWGVVCVLHDLQLIKRHADQAAMFKGGQLASVGAPQDELTAERVADIFDLDAPYDLI
ncbi:MAG: ATP-binding cassette domain-containing protein [Pseudomonadota bacterium]